MMDFQRLFEETKDLQLLFVEDYAELRENTIEILDNYFACCEGAEDGLVGLERYQAYHDRHGRYFDLVITDIKMPEMDGIALVKAIYEINDKQPIIVLSAHNESEYLLTLINIGIEQFITKPIDQDDMFMVLHKVCRKINLRGQDIMITARLKLGDETYFDKEAALFYHKEAVVKLTRNELFFMKLLSENFEKICSTDEIFHYFEYEELAISRENIRNLVNKLRKKLPVVCIESVYGIGYKLTRAL